MEFGYSWIARLISVIGYGSSSKEISVSNVILFIIGIFVFLLTFFVIYIIGLKKKDIFSHILLNDEKTPIVLKITYVFICIFLIGVLWLEDKFTDVDQASNYFRHQLPICVFIFLVYAVVNILTRIVNSNNEILSDSFRYHFLRKGEKSLFRSLSIVLFSFVAGYTSYAPNPFSDNGGGIYHLDAYTTSIINLNQLVPYSKEVNSIYGHYGIFYILPTKLLHLFTDNKWEAISLSIALGSILCYVIFSLIINNLVKNDLLFLFSEAALGLWWYSACDGNYYQLYPHRIIFQAITLGGCILLSRFKDSKFYHFLLWFISVIAIVWNTETGIICAIVIALYTCIVEWNKGCGVIRCLCGAVIEVVLAFAGAYIGTNGFNLIIGGEWLSIKTFIYPIMSDEYHVVDMLQLRLDIPISLYFIILIVYLGVVGYCVPKFLKRESDDKNSAVLLNAVMGIGCMTYYINRVCSGNLMIAFPTFVVILVTFIDSGNGEMQFGENLKINNLTNVFRRAGFILLCALALEAFGAFGFKVRNINETTHDMSYSENLEEICDIIPDENTAFIGVGTNVLCMFLRNNNMVFTMDWADMTDSAAEYCYKSIADNDEIQHLVVSGDILEEVMDYFPNARIREDGLLIFSDKYQEYGWYLVDLNK